MIQPAVVSNRNPPPAEDSKKKDGKGITEHTQCISVFKTQSSGGNQSLCAKFLFQSSRDLFILELEPILKAISLKEFMFSISSTVYSSVCYAQELLRKI